MKAIWPAMLLLAACAPAGAEGGTTWHVDFAGGDDRRDGRTPQTAWKHAPGDEAATGEPARVTLKPGDRVLFRAGVPYRGTILLPASGTAEAPIVYSGKGWGEGQAILDGSDPVTAARPCRSAADCGGAANWPQLTRIEFAAPATERLVLFGATGMYYASTVPVLPEPFFGEDRRNFTTIPKAQLDELKAGLLRAPELAAAARSGGATEIAFWIQANRVVRRPVLGVEGEVLRFDPARLRFYETRDTRAALVGSLAGVTGPGLFAPVAPGVMVAWLRPGEEPARLSVGSGRPGISLNRQAHVRIEGLHFANFSGSDEGGREGRAIASLPPGGEAIEVVGNRFGPAWLEHKSGFISVQGVNGFRFADNRVEDLFAAGLRAGGRNPSALLIEGNLFRRVGKTAISLLGVNGAIVRNNVLIDVRGVHGNGITTYEDNRDVRVEGNCVFQASRPLTFHGAKDPASRNGLVVRGNILVSTPEGQGAINSWGNDMVGVVIEGNLLAGPRFGLRLHPSDRDVTVRGNDTSGIVPAGGGSGWTIADNRTDLRLDALARGRFGEDGCAAPPGRIRLETVRRSGPAGG